MSRLILCRVGDRVQADIKLQITRSPKGLPEGWIWAPQLAPSRELFAAYLH